MKKLKLRAPKLKCGKAQVNLNSKAAGMVCLAGLPESVGTYWEDHCNEKTQPPKGAGGPQELRVGEKEACWRWIFLLASWVPWQSFQRLRILRMYTYIYTHTSLGEEEGINERIKYLCQWEVRYFQVKCTTKWSLETKVWKSSQSRKTRENRLVSNWRDYQWFNTELILFTVNAYLLCLFFLKPLLLFILAHSMPQVREFNYYPLFS